MKNKKKKLRLNKRTVWNLNIDPADVLSKDELRTANAGVDANYQVEVGTTDHPKYCKVG